MTSGNGQDLIFIQNNNNTMFVNGVVTDNAGVSIGVTKSGIGSLVLGNANTYTGDTNVNNGTLAIGNTQAVQNSTVNYNFVSGAKVAFVNGIQSATLGGLNGNGNLSTQNDVNSAVALTIGGNSASTTYGGIISGSGSVTKTGTGKLVIANNQTYTGGTTVSSGTMQLGNSTAMGMVPGNITNNGALVFAHSDNLHVFQRYLRHRVPGRSQEWGPGND